MKLTPATLVLSSVFFPLATSAQVTTDGTTSTTVNSTATGVQIDNGDRDGGNLFHSFDEFSIPTGSEAFFNNPNDIANIFSRVTGGNISNINGLIRANGTANLFLINPAGIVFGRDARLQLGGSFYGSTADSIIFPDGEFSATDLDNPPLITVNAPIGLGFRDNPEDIVNTSVGQNPDGETNITGGNVGLQVFNGETLAIIGGNVLLDDGNLTAKGGHVEIASIASAGEVGITETDTGFVFDYNAIDSFGDITLQNTAVVDVTASGGGSVNVTAKDLTLSSSSIWSGIVANSTSPIPQAGDIVINANQSVSLDDGNIFNFVGNDAIGNGGNINIKAKFLKVTNTGQIIATTLGQGDTGNVNILAEETVSFDGRDETDSFPSGIFVTVREGAMGNAGNINITTGSLQITNRAQFSTTSEGTGNAGNIYIDAANKVVLSNSILISEITEGLGIGDGGDITIKTGSLELKNGSSLLADTEHIGNAGDITIEASERVVLEGEGPGAQSGSLEEGFIIPSQITSTVDNFEGVKGEGGNISISTPFLSVADGGFIRTSTLGFGNAGDLQIEADNISVTGLDSDGFGSFIASDVRLAEAEGNGGNVEIITNNLSLTNGAKISVSTFGQGNAGKLSILANNIDLDGGSDGLLTGFFASVEEEATGQGGNITIGSQEFFVKQLTLSNGSQIIANTFSKGNAGNLSIFANDIEIDGRGNFPSGLYAQVGANATGDAGNINLTSSKLIISNGAQINANSQGQGVGGNLVIKTENLQLDSGSLSASTAFGQGGNITLEIADDLTLRNNSLISAQATEDAVGGNLTIDTRFIIAYPNSGNGNDILASAEDGEGGAININAESIIGIEERPASDNNGTNDIDASSGIDGLDGTVTIKTPDNNPLREITELPENEISLDLVTTSNICTVSDQEEESNLVVKGKGGIAPEPTEPFTSDALIIDGEPLTLDTTQTNNDTKITNPNYTSSLIKPVAYKDNGEPLYLARGIIKQADGSIILTAYPTTHNAARTPDNPDGCN